MEVAAPLGQLHTRRCDLYLLLSPRTHTSTPSRCDRSPSSSQGDDSAGTTSWKFGPDSADGAEVGVSRKRAAQNAPSASDPEQRGGKKAKHAAKHAAARVDQIEQSEEAEAEAEAEDPNRGAVTAMGADGAEVGVSRKRAAQNAPSSRSSRAKRRTAAASPSKPKGRLNQRSAPHSRRRGDQGSGTCCVACDAAEGPRSKDGQAVRLRPWG